MPSTPHRSMLFVAVLTALLAVCGTAFSLQQAGDPAPGSPGAIARKMRVESLELFDAVPLPLGEEITVRVPIDGTDRTLRLSPHSLRGESFRVLVQGIDGELVPYAPAPERTLQGRVEGLADSRVAASLSPEGELRAVIRIDDEREYAVQPLPAELRGLAHGDHAVFRSGDVLPGDETCGVPHLLPHADINRDPETQEARGGAQLFVCEIACDADREYFERNGSDVDATIADIEDVLNAVELIYERDVEITYEITTILVRTSEPDPYSTNDPGSLLSQFRSQWNQNHGGIPRDVAQLFTGKNLDGSVIGIAFVGVICGSSSYGVVQSRYTSNFLLRTSLSAHELGHNWSSGHCSGSDCRIMCPSNGGCTGDVTRFGQSSRTQIIGHRNTRGCLDTIPLPDPLELPFTETFAASTLDPVVWPDIDGAVSTTEASNEPSEPFSVRLGETGGQDDRIASERIELGSLVGEGFLSFWVEARNLESNDRLQIEAFDRDLMWTPLRTVFASQTTSDFFRFEFLPVSGSFRHDRFRLRLRAEVDDANDVFYVDNVSLVDPPAKIELVPSVSGVRAGETIFFDASVRNRRTSSIVTTAWIDVFRPDGSPLFSSNPKLGPKSVSLGPSATKGRNDIPLRIPASAPPDFNYRVIAYSGEFPDRIEHADQFFFQVAAP